MTNETLINYALRESKRRVTEDLPTLWRTDNTAYAYCVQLYSFKSSFDDDVSTMISKLKKSGIEHR